MKDYKIIQDPVHGSMRVDGMFLDLLQTPEVQRLYGIRQLGPTYLVYPGANHTRFEHSLGAFHTAKRMAGALNLSEDDRKLLKSAALLHDVGHGPYSHTLENIYEQIFGIDHHEMGIKVITGKYDMVGKGIYKERIHEILGMNGLDPKEVAGLLNGSPKGKEYLGQMIHGGIDVDKIDYLLRDAHYTGAVHGVIDLPRLLEVLEIHDNELMITRKGITSIEEMLMGRSLMFLSVYLHKTVRIIEGMMGKCVESVARDLGDFQRMNDSEFMGILLSRKGYAGEIAGMIKFRRLFKSVYSLPAKDASGKQTERLGEIGKSMESRTEFENDVCRKAGIKEGYAIVDIPAADNIIAKELGDFAKSLKIIDDGKVSHLEKYTPITSFLSERKIPDWCIMVSAHPDHTAAVKKAVESLLFR
ncbi:MAG: HD domain-containing protein [Candidatus Aenigmarchaeota archaeon]|nr:HD domain-containing protein [Candidatus Aenigmarchaeota archaeon]